MAKFFFAALLAVTVAVSFAQSEEGTQRCRDTRCQREVEQTPLDACRQLLDRRLSGLHVVVPSWMRPWEPRAQCCQQLQDVSPECRCAAIRRVVRSYDEQSLAAPPPLEGGGWCSSETAEEQQRGWYYGGQQQGGGYYGGQQEGGWYCGGSCRRQQGGYYDGETGEQQAGGRCGQREEWQPKQKTGYTGSVPRTGTGQQTTLERLAKLRQYARQLPAMCRIEPQECSIFAADQY